MQSAFGQEDSGLQHSVCRVLSVWCVLWIYVLLTEYNNMIPAAASHLQRQMWKFLINTLQSFAPSFDSLCHNLSVVLWSYTFSLFLPFPSSTRPESEHWQYGVGPSAPKKNKATKKTVIILSSRKSLRGKLLPCWSHGLSVLRWSFRGFLSPQQQQQLHSLPFPV